METFADWLRHYNKLDVAPGLEALGKMRAFYTDKDFDILKDAVSLPGVSLYSPCKEAYGMLKEAVVDGQSLVFTRYHEAGGTILRPHQFEKLQSGKKKTRAKTSLPCLRQIRDRLEYLLRLNHAAQLPVAFLKASVKAGVAFLLASREANREFQRLQEC